MYFSSVAKTYYFLFLSTAGNIDLKLKSEKGVEIPLEVTDNEDGTYLVDYAVPAGGDYSLHCRYGDVQIPQSPLKIRVPSNVDVSKVKVDGLETSKEVKLNFYRIRNSDLYVFLIYQEFFFFKENFSLITTTNILLHILA